MAGSAWAKQEDADAFLQAYACDNHIGDSILHLAVRRDDLELTKYLLEWDFPVDAHNDEGKTPLHLAAELGLHDISRSLLAWGADVFAPKLVPGADAPDVDDSAKNDKSADGDSDDDEDGGSPRKTARQTLESREKRKLTSSLHLAFERGDDKLMALFVKHALQNGEDLSEDYDLLEYMAKCYVQKRDGVLEAFRESGWDIHRQHSEYGRSFLCFVAEQAEDAEPVQALLDDDADATVTDIGGATILHVSGQRGQCRDGSVLKCLIDAGARVDVKDKWWSGTALSAAVQGTHIANVAVLLEADSDPNHMVQRGEMRRTILHLAAQDGVPEVMQLLLDYGADPNVLDELKGTPARWAIRNNHIEAVKVLLQGGLDPNFDKGNGLQMALQMGRLEIAELYVQHGAIVKRGMIYSARSSQKGNHMPLFKLCAKNMRSADEESADEDNVDLNEGEGDWKVNIKMGTFNVPRIMAMGGVKDFELCAVLVEYDHAEGLAELDDTPRALLICICADKGFLNAIPRLLSSGKISNKIRRFGVRPYRWTVMHLAARSGNIPLLEELISHGWSLDYEDAQGRSVLDLAASNGHPDMVQKLLAAHCITEHRDKAGYTPLHYAVASTTNDHRVLERIAAAGSDVHKASTSGETPLHLAARLKNEAAALWLLKKGSPASASDRYLNTPLHIAATFNCIGIMNALLSHGAQLDRAAVDGRTPLHCAGQAGANDAVAALLDAGADANKKDIQGRTALSTAIYWGQCSIETINKLLACTKIAWRAPRATHLITIASLAAKSANRGATLKCVIEALRAAEGEKKAYRIVKRLLPELVPEILVNADDSDRGSPADVIPLLLDFLPENGRTRHVALFQMLLAVIKHGEDEDGSLTRRLLLLDESNVTQAIPGNWGLQHLCCRYGRSRQLRVLLGLGLSPFSRMELDGVTCISEDVVKQFSPQMLPRFESMIEEMRIIGDMCREDTTVFPMLRRVLRPEHFTRQLDR
ncbi:hypothetical protein VE00_08798 [Pseudogymnoascus sp. WSF 3629]|nr:hypothetical protein VE00_08798 [Pseudogymnoascus sp. WSF 3629]